ncbi:MAG TPA: peptide ABC transporter substrate-binding protein [Candidatus Dormibacteraeota bacterium]|jgi:oligopeptide transport system substrate-binding protein|nr:peptide ABC transporter substrate-binding protein [Candidatus Dormibacteraeota bacterium]
MTPTSLRILKALAVGGVSSLVLVACGGGGGGGGTTLASNQTLTFPILADFGTLDPAIADAETDQEIQQNMFDGLVKFDNNLGIIPDLATAVPTASADGLSYAFKLRTDVTFSNGDKFTSKDVLYSWNRAAAMQGSYATNLSAIAGYDVVSNNKASGAALEALLEKNDPSVTLSGLTAPDASTVNVKLATPAGWFLTAIALAGSTGWIVDQNAVKQDFDNWWANPATSIGTGPFKMTARVPKQSVDFAAVPNWWGSPKPTLTKVHLDVSVTDASTAITKYEQGGYDVVGYGGYSSLPVADIKRIQATSSESSQLILHPKVRSYWVSFNMVHDAKRTAGGPFLLADGQSAHDLRLAFALAVDKAKLVTVVCQSIVCTAATGGLIPPTLIGYMGDNQDPLAKFDAAKAKSLLTGADPTGSKTKGMTYTYDPENALNKPTAEFLQSQWHDNLGVDVNIQPVSHSQFIKGRLKGQYTLSRDGWQADYNHPQDWFDNLWGNVVGCPDSGCTTGYDTKAYDTLLAKADAEALPAALTDYKALNQQLIDDVVYIPLYYTVGSFLIKPYVKGAGTNSFFDHYWNEIQINSH